MATVRIEDVVGHLDRLELRPGDRLVLSTPHQVTSHQADVLTTRLAELFPGHQVLVVDAGAQLGVVRSTQS